VRLTPTRRCLVALQVMVSHPHAPKLGGSFLSPAWELGRARGKIRPPVPRQYRPRSIMQRTLAVMYALLLCVMAHGEARKDRQDGPSEEQAHEDIRRTKAWRACIARTVPGDRYKCSLEAHGRGRSLSEGLPPVFGVSTAAAGEAQNWIVVMDDKRVSPNDILTLCDPASPGGLSTPQSDVRDVSSSEAPTLDQSAQCAHFRSYRSYRSRRSVTPSRSIRLCSVATWT
jgi:hypothetical protein